MIEEVKNWRLPLQIVLALSIAPSIAIFLYVAPTPTACKITPWQQDLRHIETAIKLYWLDHGRYPDSLGELVDNEDGIGYMPRLPKDPWGSPYQYEKLEDGYTLYSIGANRQDESMQGDDQHLDQSAPKPEPRNKKIIEQLRGALALNVFFISMGGLGVATLFGFALMIRAVYRATRRSV